ncbi:MAG: class I SAM-dependent methyltransferase [Rhodobacteraceae bacterium]|nr:class I SAM-dependent methyltransferase [Paracoccaceae bacterium]
MSTPDAETLAVYDARAREYAAMVDDGPNARLQDFLERVPPKARLLDLGCGTGAMTVQMRAAEHEVVALDPSTGMAEEAKARYGLKVQIGDFDDIPRLGHFDGVWAHFSLLHAPRTDLPRHLAAIHAALRPDGIFLIAMKTGTGAARDGLGRHYTYVTETELHDLLEDAGFTPRSVETGSEEGFDGVVAPWVVMTADA